MSDLVGRGRAGTRGWWVASLASLSTLSLPRIPEWPGTYMKAILMFKREAVKSRMWIREMTGCVDWVLEIEGSEDGESDAIKKDGVAEGEIQYSLKVVENGLQLGG